MKIKNECKSSYMNNNQNKKKNKDCNQKSAEKWKDVKRREQRRMRGCNTRQKKPTNKWKNGPLSQRKERNKLKII